MEERQRHLIFTFLLFFVSLTLLSRKLLEQPQPQPQAQSNSGKHFVLIHGAMHGAWCWYKVMQLLQSSGHNVTALDLAASGIDLNQAKDLKSISEYFQPLMDFMESLPSEEKIVLVGHSLGGLAISKAMEVFPRKISVAVFVAAMMPAPTLNMSALYNENKLMKPDFLDTQFTYDDGPDKPPATMLYGQLYLRKYLYQLSPSQDLALATTVIRAVRLFREEDKGEVMKLSIHNYGSVKRVYVVSEKDVAGEDGYQWDIIAKNPPNEVVEIKGSDHMVMMSKPLDLFLQLRYIAHKYS